MNEYELPATENNPPESGDVDDLIFRGDCEWYISER